MSIHGVSEMIRIREYFYTLTEAADALGVNRLTIRRWIQTGKLEYQRVGGVVLLERADIERIRREREG